MIDTETSNNNLTKKRSGPPNRMNDLIYRDWMKFQKSFFRFKDYQNLIEECVCFFTKAIWPDNRPSQTLIIGFEDINKEMIPKPRQIEYKSVKSIGEIVKILKQKEEYYDFVLIDLTNIDSEEKLADFLNNDADLLFYSLRRSMVTFRYCGVVSKLPRTNGSGFPIPWSIAFSSRNHLRLRDEKVGLVEATGQILYCLFMQAEDDSELAKKVFPNELSIFNGNIEIPSWTIPKSPPRSSIEVLHPAKFPETLVEEFIKLFTKPGDNVFDPMAGTGSTLIAALRNERNAIGVELSPEWASIGQNRLNYELQPTLFGEPLQKAKMLQGDATNLDAIGQLNGVYFDYVVTSPPYWSMLTNPGSENQRNRRNKNLPLTYSKDQNDLGNIQDYNDFLDKLVNVYDDVVKKLNSGGFITIVVKNVKRNHILYCLAWDLTIRLCQKDKLLEYAGTTLWCQDDVGLKPFAVGTHWVSNILHQYCLHFRKK